MATLYFFVGNELRSEIDDQDVAVTAVPLMGGTQAASLINRAHLQALVNWYNTEFGLTTNLLQVLGGIGVVDKRT
jgi:hypothetical protein